jgi:hypothetical protein
VKNSLMEFFRDFLVLIGPMERDKAMSRGAGGGGGLSV